MQLHNDVCMRFTISANNCGFTSLFRHASRTIKILFALLITLSVNPMFYRWQFKHNIGEVLQFCIFEPKCNNNNKYVFVLILGIETLNKYASIFILISVFYLLALL